jgi:formylglycine-generating enzyme required for sulfatase activity
MGTPHYMPPEQFSSARDVGPQADVWSLGVTLYELLAGDLPWLASSIFDLAVKIRQEPFPDLRRRRADLSGEVCAIIAKALEKNPRERYTHCGEMGSALRAHLASLRPGEPTALADAGAGRTKFAMVKMPPPSSRTKTLIWRSIASMSSVPQPPASGPVQARSGRIPSWLRASGAILVALVVIFAAVFAVGARQNGEEDPLEAEAQQLLDRATGIAADGRLDEAARLVAQAGGRYDATSAGPKLARLAVRCAAGMAKKGADEDRTRREGEAKLTRLLADAQRHESEGRLDAALASLREVQAVRDDVSVRARLAAVRKRMDVATARAEVRRRIAAGAWRPAWDAVQDARENGLADPDIDELARLVAKELAPKDNCVGPAGIEFVLVPGGTFRMGSDAGEQYERPVHEVTVSSFYLGRYEITQSQYEAVMGVNPSRAKGAGLPVEQVSWFDAVGFCRKLSGMGDARFRLPTEAEWEYAARGAAGRVYPWGNTPPEVTRANLRGDSDGHEGAAPVGSFPAGVTPEGVRDLAGNVAEWCADWVGPYAAAAAGDPAGPDAGTIKVVRGGAFIHDAACARAATRRGRKPGEPVYLVGFRVVRELTDEERMFLPAPPSDAAGGRGGGR